MIIVWAVASFSKHPNVDNDNCCGRVTTGFDWNCDVRVQPWGPWHWGESGRNFCVLCEWIKAISCQVWGNKGEQVSVHQGASSVVKNMDGFVVGDTKLLGQVTPPHGTRECPRIACHKLPQFIYNFKESLTQILQKWFINPCPYLTFLRNWKCPPPCVCPLMSSRYTIWKKG